MEDLVKTFASYVPKTIVNQLSENPEPIQSPFSENFPAAVLFADVSGFTALTERLARAGPEGVEILSRMLNAYFGKIVEIVYQSDGDIYKFAGDALVAVWPVDTRDGGNIGDLLGEKARAATMCASSIQGALENFDSGFGIPFSLKLGIGVGTVTVVHVGGGFDRWEFVVSGPPFEQIRSAERLAQPNEIVVSPQAWDMVKMHFSGAHLENGFVRIGENLTVVEVLAGPSIPLNPEIRAGLEAYIPGAILSRIAVGQRDWLAELRHVTVIFVNLLDMTYHTDLDLAQRAMEVLQARLYDLEGSVNKITIDDKGTTMVAVMGLPPVVHENDEVRGVLAARAMQSALRSLGWRSAIGVASGRVFCGAIGNDQRREYTVIGETVNLAARLMVLASQPEYQNAGKTILCDEETSRNSGSEIAFSKLAAVRVKGISEYVSPYLPIGEKEAVSESQAQDHREDVLIGRAKELSRIISQLKNIIKRSVSSVVVVEGEAGIGKSRLVLEVIREADQLGFQILLGGGDAIEKLAPYYAWREIFEKIFDLHGKILSMTREEVRSHAMAALQELMPGDEAVWSRLLPLLNPVLPCEWPETEFTENLSGEVRADNIASFYHDIITRKYSRGNTSDHLLIVFEDAHWLDSASWGLIQRLYRSLIPFGLTLVMRPLRSTVLKDYELLLNKLPSLVNIKLGPLSPADSLLLACHRLGVEELPEPISKLIIERAEGHPFFCEELIYALRDAGYIKIKAGNCELESRISRLEDLAFPNTIEGVITSRIDALSAQQQLTLKVASVIGRVFGYKTLAHIYPILQDKPKLITFLSELDQLDLTPVVPDEIELTYIFKHIVTQEVAYKLLLFSHRKQLHESILRWYENHHQEDLSIHYSLLSHHALRAENSDKAITYLVLAGLQAMQNYANQEAIEYFRSVDRFVVEKGLTIESHERASWRHNLGVAYIGIGDLQTAKQHFHAALDLLGRPVPNTSTGMFFRICFQLARQLLRRLRRRALKSLDDYSLRRQQETARIYDSLAEVHFFDTNALPIINSALSVVNYAETVGPSIELARGYLNISYALWLFPLRRMADWYRRKAKSTLSEIDHLPTSMHAHVIFSLSGIGSGLWARSTELLQKVRSYGVKYGDQKKLAEAYILLEQLNYYKGDYKHAMRYAKDLKGIAVESGNNLHLAWAYSAIAECSLRVGALTKGLESAQNALELYQLNRDHISETATLGLLAQLNNLKDDFESADKYAIQTNLRLAEVSAPTSFYFLDAYVGVVEIEASRYFRGESRSLKKLSDSIEKLRKFARIFPMAKPRYLYYQGLYHAVQSDKTQARFLWEEAVNLAENLEMPFDSALAMRALGESYDAENPVRESLLKESLRIFERLNCRLEVDMTSQLLSG